jgi:hypothetical protein
MAQREEMEDVCPFYCVVAMRMFMAFKEAKCA